MVELLEKRINEYREMAKNSNSMNDKNYYDGLIDGLIIAIKELENNQK